LRRFNEQSCTDLLLQLSEIYQRQLFSCDHTDTVSPTERFDGLDNQNWNLRDMDIQNLSSRNGFAGPNRIAVTNRAPVSRWFAFSLCMIMASVICALPILNSLIRNHMAHGIWSSNSTANTQPVNRDKILALPVVEPTEIMAITPEDAQAINAAIPDSKEAIAPARPFAIPGGFGVNLSAPSALACLTAAIYYEAGYEPLQGQRAVAQVILNRVRHPAFPKSVCGVVNQGSERSTGCQFSFTCDGSLARKPNPAVWDRARGVAIAALGGSVEPSVGQATHYHANYVVPYWAKTLVKVKTIGAHIFYRWPGYWGKPSAFSGQYQGEAPESSSVVGDVIGMTGDGDLIGMGTNDQANTTTEVPDPIIAAPFKILVPNAPVTAGVKPSEDGKDGQLLADQAHGTLITK
jgi:Cell Wall Hydrolase